MGWYHSMIAEGHDAYGNDTGVACSIEGVCSSASLPVDNQATVVYHMAQKSLWDAARKQGKVYYPPTFEESGRITRASVNPDALLKIANIAYQKEKGEWVCLALDPKALAKEGIVTRIEECDEKGGIGESCRQLHGGIPTSTLGNIMKRVYSMERSKEGSFISIPGLIDDKEASDVARRMEILRRFV